ncbi:MAG: GTPase Era [Peptococcaceae bacterium]|nr:GTPase Era [Peptococcaceae bacterium]MBQ2021282.1 GTPase Era [Peptococcaceae bacterium]MBQ2369782.1 GTPase Era [Peptococcaceae bacterium]MBQ5369835.1 GTPase Era [Peptococcaceae bacterium]MBQ5615011.1 GTPase Era [Peptococcaceae bacterium]
MCNMKTGFVTLVGRPNAGKSTLLNQILDRKIAIVSDKAQTTRHRITGVLTNETGQIVFLDTPGIHKPRHKLGERMVEIAQSSLYDADVVYYLVDVNNDFGPGEQYILNQLQKTDAPVFLLLNKIDRIEKQEVLGLIAQWQSRMEFAEIFPLSAYKGDNVEALVETTFKYLEEGPQFYPADSVTDQPEEVVIAELIREQILQSTRDEVPHSIAVIVEQMKLQDDGKIYVGATIYVERDSQKGIIIGKAGTMLRKIGSRARREIEFLLGEKVYLDLWVKVNEDWRNKETAIKSLYLEDDDDEF